MVKAITTVTTNSPAPNKDPMLQDIPSSESEATIAVITSPAPLEKANSVTPARASESRKYFAR